MVKKTFHVEADFVTNLVVNISEYIWSGDWVPMIFLILVLFHLVLYFSAFMFWYIYTLSVKILSVLIFIGDNFRPQDKSLLIKFTFTDKIFQYCNSISLLCLFCCEKLTLPSYFFLIQHFALIFKINFPIFKRQHLASQETKIFSKCMSFIIYHA